MANIKSAKKRILVNRTKMERNKAIKSGVKTAVKKVYAAIDANDKEAAKAALLSATFWKTESAFILCKKRTCSVIQVLFYAFVFTIF